MGAGNKTWLGRLLHGSTSTQVLHSSPSGVLVVHQAAPKGPVRVLVTADGSDDARLAGRLLADLAEPDRCRVTVLCVVTLVDLAVVPGPSELDPASIPTDSVEFSALEKKRIAEGRERAQRAAAELKEAGFQADAKAVVGNPVQVILESADVGASVSSSWGRADVGRSGARCSGR